MTPKTFDVPSADLRSHEILASIRQAFAARGFDGASMQDLARAAGMSVGNFYRYFPSKSAIIEAMVGMDLAEIERDFSEIGTSTDPIAALRTKILERITDNSREDGQLWAEITAAAIRFLSVLTSDNIKITTVCIDVSIEARARP